MKIAIAGYGIEGSASYEYWNTNANELVIVDERTVLNNMPDQATTMLGDDVFAKLDEFDLIIRSPSVNPHKLPYNGKIWSATNEFFAKCPAPIIGVTGTKGKGTTCSLIASILRAAGKTVHLVGNIGTPALAELANIQPDDIVVFELSSFQLWDAQRSPQIAVVLMIEPDHLDVHDDMDDYVAAKTNIVRHQTDQDVVVFNAQNEISTKIAQGSAARKIDYPFAIDEFVPSLKIPGKHNQENAAAAIAVVRELGVDDDAIKRGLAVFTGLPHRLKFVAEKNGVEYYDDSIATTPGSAIAALKSFDEPKVLILGGSDKGVEYDEVIGLCQETDTAGIAIGQNGAMIADLCKKYDVWCVREEGDMSAIVSAASHAANKKGVVLLSPAAASFDMFENYADRGDQFAAAVTRL